MEFSFSGISVAQGQTGLCHPVPRVSGLPAVCGRACALKGHGARPFPRTPLPRRAGLAVLRAAKSALMSESRDPQPQSRLARFLELIAAPGPSTRPRKAVITWSVQRFASALMTMRRRFQECLWLEQFEAGHGMGNAMANWSPIWIKYSIRLALAEGL